MRTYDAFEWFAWLASFSGALSEFLSATSSCDLLDSLRTHCSLCQIKRHGSGIKLLWNF